MHTTLKTELAAFAKKAGVSIVTLSVRDAIAFGGSLAYKEADNPHAMVCGFRTEHAAYTHWLKGTFGEQTGKAVLSLLRRSSKGDDNV